VKTTDTLILGIGNTLLADEGVGIHALKLLHSSYPDLPDVSFIDGGTLSFTLAAYIEDCDKLIVLDAAELNSRPGTVKTMVGEEMDIFLGAARRSPHEVSLLDLFDMDIFLGAARRSPHEVSLLDLFDIARLTESLPGERALIGVQPGLIEWGTKPTQPVKQALGTVVNEAVNLLSIWHRAQKQIAGGCQELPADELNPRLSIRVGL